MQVHALLPACAVIAVLGIAAPVSADSPPVTTQGAAALAAPAPVAAPHSTAAPQSAMDRAREDGVLAVHALTTRLAAASGNADSLRAIQRQIEQAKRDAYVAYLRALIDDARSTGDEARARAGEEALSNALAPAPGDPSHGTQPVDKKGGR